MTYKDLFDAQHEYCKTEGYPGTFIRPHAFIAGAKWVIKYLNDLSAIGALETITNLYDELQEEEMLTKWTLKKMSPFVPNKCESCDRFDECYTSSGYMREFCKMYGANVVFKRKEQWEHQEETDLLRYGAKRPLNGVAVAYFATATYPKAQGRHTNTDGQKRASTAEKQLRQTPNK